MKNYELHPKINVKDKALVASGYPEITDVLKERIATIATDKKSQVLVIEMYPGADIARFQAEVIAPLQANVVIDADEYTLPKDVINAKLADTLTEDRVFGLMTHAKMADFFDEAKCQAAKAEVQAATGLVVIYGVGASLLCEQADTVVYVDMARWEIQLRYRNGLTNWKAEPETDALKKFKRGYFFEWRIADKRKQALNSLVDFVIDGNQLETPTMMTGEVYREVVAEAAQRPFRLVPYFDTSVWGGQWMKENFQLDAEKPNYGWAFDGVVEENSVIFDFENGTFEMPAINIVHQEPQKLLGARVYGLFGKEFPIRFDYLDTVGGGNLSLQVHPLVEYIQETFGMNYTQNESYYILQAGEKSSIYLGVKEGTQREELFAALTQAQEKGVPFDDTKFINNFPIKKHDHYSIPAGTIHCGGEDTVVLEISATPYIFTFKLWDWGRTGLDGKPRPIHLEHGIKNVRTDFDTTYAKEHLFNPNTKIQTEQADLDIEKTGLADIEFIETRRYWFEDSFILDTLDSVNMLNLVEGSEIDVISIDDSFPTLRLHYGETFIIPESVKKVQIKNCSGTKAGLLQAFIK